MKPLFNKMLNYIRPGFDKKLIHQFEKENNLIILSRIKLLSIIDIIMTFLYTYAVIFLASPDSRIYVRNVIIITLFCFILSISYLIIYAHLKRIDFKVKEKWINFIIYIYIAELLLAGSLSAINSQLSNGNINNYIIFVLIAAFIFTFRPRIMIGMLIVNHIFLLIGFHFVKNNVNLLMTIQVNTAGLIIFAVLINVTQYNAKVKQFINQLHLQKSEENFRKFFDVNPYPLFLVHYKEGSIIDCNNKAAQIFNFTKDNLLNKSLNDLLPYNEEKNKIEKNLKQYGKAHNHIVEIMIGQERKYLVANFEMIIYKLQTCLLIGVTDITEMKILEQKLTKYATTDMLTGVLNRRTGIQFIEGLLNKSKYKFLEFVICFIDINHLKEVNDTYGHAEGDFYIKKVCSIIESVIDNGDILFRMGGDEFIIVFTNKEAEQVKALWNRMLKELNEYNTLKEKPYEMMASHGLFEYKSGMEITLEEIVKMADLQMYNEKSYYHEN